jgi:caffeoyl-CoA O-methyltransferase
VHTVRSRAAGRQNAIVDIVRPEIERYVEEHTTPPPTLLEELTAETWATMGSPEMLTGVVQGRLLELLVYVAGARSVLEIGTFTGYSALSMAAGLPPDGHIDTCEIDPERAELARRYIARSPYADRITVHVGPALESVAALEGAFDFVFIDADKPNYVHYIEAVLTRLSDHGLIAVDNTLWSGEVVEPHGDTARVIAGLNGRLAADPRLVVVQLTVRDGLTLIRRR